MILVYLLILQLICSLLFYYYQNKGKLTGGRISLPKALWLFHAIFSWYFVPLALLSYFKEFNFLAIVLFVHTFVWWLRAPIELIMMYKFKNWSPNYGITHDAIHLILLLIALSASPYFIDQHSSSMIDKLTQTYLTITSIMLIFETVFAYLFLKIRGHQEHTIYYASNDPQWKFVNFLTKIALLIGLTHLIWQAVSL